MSTNIGAVADVSRCEGDDTHRQASGRAGSVRRARGPTAHYTIHPRSCAAADAGTASFVVTTYRQNLSFLGFP